MQRCLELASRGFPLATPNPLVGSVIIFNEKIIGEGWHQVFGKAHAEVNAIESVDDKSVLPESRLFVSLEPCSHFGKTPPCADLIIRSGIREVVVASLDPNPLVAGKGIEMLRKAGIVVKTGLLDDESKELNRRFFTFYEKKRPFIILKWAQTSDGFIAKSDGSSKWISSELSRTKVHKWRSEEKAILVGKNTVIIDDPLLTVRSWQGNNPLRLLIDPDLETWGKDFKIFNREAATIVFNYKKEENQENLSLVKIDRKKLFISQVCDFLYSKGIQSVIVEGGSQTLQSFIKENLWDEARVFVAPVEFGEGLKAPQMNATETKPDESGGDQLFIYRN